MPLHAIWEQAKCLGHPPSSCATRRPEATTTSATKTTTPTTSYHSWPKVETPVRLGLGLGLGLGCCPGCFELLCM